MGDRESIEVVVILTRNNSDRDEQDDALWTELKQKVQDLVYAPRYEQIRAECY